MSEQEIKSKPTTNKKKSTAKAQPAPSITTEQVAKYLQEHPAFFVEQQELLADMVLPHASGDATSLIERQAQVMRDRNSELRQRLDNLMTTARENDRIFRLSKELALALLEATSLEATAKAVQHSLHQEFKVDCASLILFDLPMLQNKGFITQTSKEAAQRVLGNLIRGDAVHCSALREEEFHYLFPNTGSTNGSAALVPLHFNRDLGILAIGSHDAKHFATSMDTALIDYIGQILSRRLSALIKEVG